MCNKQRQPKSGIVLLVVLGMLSLFSVLVVSYVVFSSQMADTSYAASEKRLTDIAPEPVLDDAILRLLVGTDDPKSAMFGMSIMEDLWGTDGLSLRVGHRRGGGSPPATSMPTNGQGMLLRPLAAGRPQTTLFKFPTNRAAWDHDGTPASGGPPLTSIPSLTPPLRDNLDDIFAGRIVTFVEGPLYGVSFRVVRSFGRSNTGSNDEDALAGCLVIDLSEMPSEEISVDGATEPLYLVAGNSPNRLLYNVGPDGEPGQASVDDNGSSGADDASELGWPGTDDIGYRFVINGRPFNGSGQNPAGVTGIKRAGTVIDKYGHIELQPNARLMGMQASGGNLTTSAFPSQDEQWDAADLENWFLAWQPSDHRRAQAAIDPSQFTFYSDAELKRQLGQHIIPSFHRPAVINHLMNAPIWIDGDITDPANVNYFERTFSQLTGDFSAPNKDHLRLSALITRLRRATMRPLNFSHLFLTPNLSDFDGDNIPYDGAPGFSGSNPTPILAEIIQPDPADMADSTEFANLKAQISRLAVWLINGPWDVDNDNDGIPDSLFVDFNLAPVQAPDGRWIKPMIAPLIEDLDGKINVNAAGSYNQLLTQNFRSSNLNGFSSDAEYFDVLASLGVFGRGGGVGPAEIDFSHLFDEGSTFSAPLIGPVFRTQTSNPVSAVLTTRYGNLLNARYGGQIFDYIAPYPAALSFTKLPGRGDVANPQVNADLLSRIPFPSRLTSHVGFAPMGEPIDIAGRSQARIDRYGNRRFTNMATSEQFPWGNELVNTPYEPGINGSLGDDKPFTPHEYHDFVNGGELAGRLTQLLGDAADRNEALRRLLATESRSLDVPEVVGTHDILHLIASKLDSSLTNAQVHLDRMLAVELRKGSKLNLNRPLGNGVNDNAAGPDANTDETFETETQLITTPVLPNTANNRRGRYNAFPKIAAEYPSQALVPARYAPTRYDRRNPQQEFNGIDANGNGILDATEGRDFDGDGVPDRVASGNELLARHLYCLMFSLIADPGNPVFVEHFPYPNNFTADPAIRNRYAARRLAQWAVNAVDYRDTDVTCTRLRYDPNPFDGFNLATAQRTVVWGMERPEVEITETVAFHDKRLRRNLDKEEDPMDPAKSLDGELQVDEDPDDTDGDLPDSDMDQFRIPEASAFVELRNLRSPVANSGTGQPSYPPELYTNVAGIPRLDLGRTVGSGNLESPVYRLAVGQATAGQRARSTRWNFDAERIGRELVANNNRSEELDYLTVPAIDYTVPADVNTEVDAWNQATRHAAEVRHNLSATGEFVTIADDDFDPSNDGASPHRIRLERFVWFSKSLMPNNTLNVISNAASGMELGNVFYNKDDLSNPGDSNDPDNAAPTLAPGQYAIIGPRQETRFGQTNVSAAPMYPYSPVDHRLEFVSQTTASVPPFRMNFVGLTGTIETPRYEEDNASSYDVHSVVPILCQSLYPHEVAAARADWASYLAKPADERVDMGFNISAPDSGPTYYQAPTQRIATMAGKYPLIDGYRDYDGDVGFHPDEPLDHVAGTPMELNNWDAVGTHQEARTVFLQRLADPTTPWHPIDNPYLTIDFMPIDLTTFNGEHDVRQLIDRDGDTNADEMVDDRTIWDPVSGEFDPALKFDSRRKIPDVTRDRGITVLLANVATPGAVLNQYDRVIMAKRSAMSATASVLRDTPENAAATAYWKFSLESMWNAGSVAAAAAGLDTSYAVNRTFDTATDPFRQSLGFVNREYGQPLRSDSPRAKSLGTGTPDEVFLSSVPWPNREFQSPLDLINVPATSRTGILATFSPGTELQDSSRREVPGHFDHLLGFNAGYANYRAADESSLKKAGPLHTDVDDLTGDRAGFEQIFDYVETGPVWCDSQRWLEPSQVSFLQGDPASLGLRENMFNRVVETLQPPFNFIGKHRTPGLVNLNTTPDYIRRGATFLGSPMIPAGAFTSITPRVNELLDIGERPDDPATPGVGHVAFNPNNNTNNGNGFSTQFRNSDLYGNGSVHRALTWGISTAYELDGDQSPWSAGLPTLPNVQNQFGSPVVLGQFNRYGQTVDTRFGRSFKAFIESRRGYSSVAAGSYFFGNPVLDWRYPTQFAGVFGPAQAAAVPSVQRFMRTESAKGVGVRRRTHDMSLLRPHPDFDLRTMSDGDRGNVQNASDTSYSIRAEADQTGGSVTLPPLASSPQEIVDLRMPLVNTGLFERSQAELHQNFRNLDRDAFFRHQNAAKLANLTTHHSNVFLVRMTLGYFVVDPTTGSVSGEYVSDTGNNLRSKATYVIDRSIPIGFLRGLDVNAMNTVIYSAIEE